MKVRKLFWWAYDAIDVDEWYVWWKDLRKFRQNADKLICIENKLSSIVRHVTNNRYSDTYYKTEDIKSEIDDRLSEAYERGYKDGYAKRPKALLKTE